jgi:hypothetical protein
MRSGARCRPCRRTIRRCSLPLVPDNIDDDPASIDWGPEANTTIDAPPIPEADTAKFKSLDWAIGREAGFDEGVTVVLRVLATELLAAGLTQADAGAIIRRIRLAALGRG